MSRARMLIGSSSQEPGVQRAPVARPDRGGIVALTLVALLALLLQACGSAGETAAEPEDDAAEAAAGDEDPSALIEGRRVTLIVPNSPGKGMDTYARMIVPYLEEYSSASDIVVQNIVGAGGVEGVNQLWSSEPDGSTIAFTSVPSIMLADLSGSEGVQFTATDLTYFGRASTEPRVLAVGGSSEIDSADDLRNLGRPFIFPTQGTDEDFFTMAVLAEGMGFELEAVTGYEGNADTSLAVVSGQGDGHITALTDAQPLIEEGDKKPIIMISSERVDDYPEVPTALEVVEGEGARAVEAIIEMVGLHRSFFGPPGMDEQTTTAWRAAVEQALNDPDLQAEAEEIRLPIAFMHGDEEQARVQRIAEASQDIVPILQRALEALQ